MSLQLRVKFHLEDVYKEAERYGILSETLLGKRGHLVPPLFGSEISPSPIWIAPSVEHFTLHDLIRRYASDPQLGRL